MKRANKKLYDDSGSLTAVRRELRKANYADVAAVSIGLRHWWNPIALWRAGVFIFRNQRRKKLLARMSKARMGFAWRDSRPLKLQRKLGLKPQI